MADGLLNKASIILTPTGYKAGTLYNVAPVVEPYEDFDFARASVASRVNSSGLVEMVGRSLGSELVTNGDFATDSDWTLGTGWSIGDNVAKATSAPFSASIYQSISTQTNKVYEVQIEIKNYSLGTLRVNNRGGYVDVPQSNGTHTIYLQTQSSSDNFLYLESRGSLTASIDNISVKEIIDTNNIPRISYDSNGDNGHILLEPTSTNLITYSEDLTQLYWTTTSLDVETSLVTAPDGSSYANKLVPDDGIGGFKGLSRLFNSLSGLHTVSFFAKKGEYNYIMLRTRNSPNTGVMFNLDNGTFSINIDNDILVDNSIYMTALPNDWYRCELTLDPSEATVVGQLNLGWNVGITGNEQNSFSGDGVSGVYLWGVQFEALSYATSYIPTLTGSQEVRATETATGAGSADLINSTEGVLYAEIAGLVDADTSDRVISLSDNTITNRVEMKLSSSGSIQGRFDSASSDITLTETGLTASNFNKIALIWSSGKCALFINGVKEQEDLTFNTFASDVLFDLSFDSAYLGGSSNFYGEVKALAVFNEALSDSELTQLTT